MSGGLQKSESSKSNLKRFWQFKHDFWCNLCFLMLGHFQYLCSSPCTLLGWGVLFKNIVISARLAKSNHHIPKQPSQVFLDPIFAISSAIQCFGQIGKGLQSPVYENRWELDLVLESSGEEMADEGNCCEHFLDWENLSETPVVGSSWNHGETALTWQTIWETKCYENTNTIVRDGILKT
jgi:hypothetical protein